MRPLWRQLWRQLGSLLALILLMGTGAAGYAYLGLYDVAAATEHHAATQRVLEGVRSRSVERRAGNIEVMLPEPIDETQLHEAVVGYEDMCASCHAPPGRKRSAMALGLNPPASDLTLLARRRSAAELFWVTKHGIRMTGMPAWGATHSDDELWAVVALVRRLPDLSGAEYEGLLREARAAGVEHHHPEGHHGGDHGHGHEGHRHDEGRHHGHEDHGHEEDAQRDEGKDPGHEEDPAHGAPADPDEAPDAEEPGHQH